ncbi:MAG: LptF/LptG family permease [Crocinitomicaceae bacterium]|nr:LptF/LptG family permease [Crocinitomicaceae bacterium]
MKRLYSFSIRSFTGPFLVTFAISMFILIMQFFWKYIDDLMGKGLSISVIVELLFYVSASLIPLALPLAILLSSIMTLGNLAENNELTALKSSGLSLYRILRPLTGIVIIIALSTFYFANYVIPVANLKWHGLIFDIQQTKISSILTPGTYSKELDGYAIKIDEGTEDTFKGILIHDHTDKTIVKSVRAKEGNVYKSENGKYLFFELKDGYVMEELNPAAPSFTPDGQTHGKENTRPSRRSSFDHATYKIDLSGFNLDRSDDDMFKDKHEMLNVFQINYTLDSIQKNASGIVQNFLKNLKNDHAYFVAKNFEVNSIAAETDQKITEVADSTVLLSELSSGQMKAAINLAQTKIRSKSTKLDSQKRFLETMEIDMNKYLIEFHRKFSLTLAIIVLFFIGAPLGAIVRKGGFGAPVVIAALLFMIYFVLMTIGDGLANSGTVSPFLGMWFPCMALTPAAIWLMYSAANDSPVFSKDAWKKFIRLKR